MKRYAQLYNGEVVVHYEGADGNDLLLCGQDMDGDSVIGDEWARAYPTTRRVTCPQCKQIVAHVRGTSVRHNAGGKP